MRKEQEGREARRGDIHKIKGVQQVDKRGNQFWSEMQVPGRNRGRLDQGRGESGARKRSPAVALYRRDAKNPGPPRRESGGNRNEVGEKRP
jgi:hypothetical protein